MRRPRLDFSRNPDNAAGESGWRVCRTPDKIAIRVQHQTEVYARWYAYVGGSFQVFNQDAIEEIVLWFLTLVGVG